METKKAIFKRVPPGDRWVEIGNESGQVFISLTDALEHRFQRDSSRQFNVDTVEGIIYKIETAPDPVPVVRKFNIYGDA